MKLYRDYKLTINIENKQAFIGMQVLTPFVNTRNLKKTYKILNHLKPEIFATECFNENNLSFHEEVKNTELGHLFEHILLTVLLDIKIKEGAKVATYQGTTSWNWKKDPYGYFRINIKLCKKDHEIFEDALFETIDIFNRVLETADLDHDAQYNKANSNINSAMKTFQSP